VRATTFAAGGLACAGAAMTIAAFAGGGSSSSAPAAQPVATPARDGLAVWAEQGCGSCHTFAPANSSGPIGPNLGVALAGKDAEYVKAKIVAPRPDYGMPDDFATRISPPDLDRLVDFLLSAQ